MKFYFQIAISFSRKFFKNIMWYLAMSITFLLAYGIQNSDGKYLQNNRNESIRRSERRIIRENIFKWSYEDKKTGVSEWPKMFKDCGGSQQSPVDIDTGDALKSTFLKPLQLHGYKKALDNPVILNNGHTVLIKTGNNSHPPFIHGGGLSGKYTFQQLHFHWGSSNDKGSEHRIDGKTYPAEVHLVHASNKGTGDIAVVAVFLQISEYGNPDLDPIISSLRKVPETGQVAFIRKPFSLSKLLPKSMEHYYRYVGSLTTPPCSEGVVWTVLAKHIHIGKHQLKAFRKLMASSKPPHSLSDNFRQPQEMHQRIILESVPSKAKRVSQQTSKNRRISPKI